MYTAINNLTEINLVDQNIITLNPNVDKQVPGKESSINTGDNINIPLLPI